MGTAIAGMFWSAIIGIACIVAAIIGVIVVLKFIGLFWAMISDAAGLIFAFLVVGIITTIMMLCT